MKVPEIVNPIISARLEGKSILALKELQKEQIIDKTKKENSFEQEAQNKIDLLV